MRNWKTLRSLSTWELQYLLTTVASPPTIMDLSIKATRVVYALNNKIKLSKLPTKLALKLFNTLISPILLYGSEVWGPYANLDLVKWDKSKIEQVHIQFIKRILGCNVMSEVGQRPLLVDIIKRTTLYIQGIQKRKVSLVYEAWRYELSNNIIPNFATYMKMFDLMEAKKNNIKKICHDNYERFWEVELNNSPKAISCKTYKANIKFVTTIMNDSGKWN